MPTESRLNGASPSNDDGSFSSPQQASSPQTNGARNPVTAAQNAAANTEGTTTEKARNAAVAAGGAAAATAGAAAAYVSSTAKDVTNRTVNGDPPAYSGSRTLEEAEAEIKRLQQKLEAANKRSGGNTMQHHGQEGVPVHIVAAIAFGIFAITYLFF